MFSGGSPSPTRPDHRSTEFASWGSSIPVSRVWTRSTTTTGDSSLRVSPDARKTPERRAPRSQHSSRRCGPSTASPVVMRDPTPHVVARPRPSPECRGLSRRRSRVRVPSLPSKDLQIGRLWCPDQTRNLTLPHQRAFAAVRNRSKRAVTLLDDRAFKPSSRCGDTDRSRRRAPPRNNRRSRATVDSFSSKRGGRSAYGAGSQQSSVGRRSAESRDRRRRLTRVIRRDSGGLHPSENSCSSARRWKEPSSRPPWPIVATRLRQVRHPTARDLHLVRAYFPTG